MIQVVERWLNREPVQDYGTRANLTTLVLDICKFDKALYQGVRSPEGKRNQQSHRRYKTPRSHRILLVLVKDQCSLIATPDRRSPNSSFGSRNSSRGDHESTTRRSYVWQSAIYRGELYVGMGVCEIATYRRDERLDQIHLNAELL